MSSIIILFLQTRIESQEFNRIVVEQKMPAKIIIIVIVEVATGKISNYNKIASPKWRLSINPSSNHNKLMRLYG